MKKHNLFKYTAAVCLFAVCLLFSAITAKAAYVEDDTNGLSYNDTVYISSGYANEWSNGGADYVSVHLDNDGDRVVNVKSSSKYLLAKKTSESFTHDTDTDYDYEQDKYVTTTSSRYRNAYISFFGKKKGTYKVTFDVIDKTGKVKCTKTIKVYVDKYGTTSSAIKSVKYNGKDLWKYYPFCSKTKGTLKVKLNKGYSLVSIYVQKRNSKGEWTRTKVKNGKKITLAKSAKYTSDDDWAIEKYNPFFPQTRIVITAKNKKTKEVTTYSESLYTINKK